MAERPVLQPTAEHPITVTPTPGRVVVRINGEVVADTSAALTLQESTYPAVQYIPIEHVKRQVLTRPTPPRTAPSRATPGTTACTSVTSPWTTPSGSTRAPIPAVGEIAGHVAFYPNKADVTVTP